MFLSFNLLSSPTSTDTNSLSCDDTWQTLSSTSKEPNTSERVRVPSSDHVAEIVGRQGAKIKELRSRTSTYIKTPVKDEEPVFIITGRKEDIEVAKKEILTISDNFTQMRSSKLYGGGLSHSNIFECVKTELSVPYDVVGLVVGPKGSTIKEIQKKTQTYIVTPNRDQKPVFQISGLAENVSKAMEHIKTYVLLRTGKSLPECNWKLNRQEARADFVKQFSYPPVVEDGLFQRVSYEDSIYDSLELLKQSYNASPTELKPKDDNLWMDGCMEGGIHNFLTSFPFLPISTLPARDMLYQ